MMVQGWMFDAAWCTPLPITAGLRASAMEPAIGAIRPIGDNAVRLDNLFRQRPDHRP